MILQVSEISYLRSIGMQLEKPQCMNVTILFLLFIYSIFVTVQ